MTGAEIDAEIAAVKAELTDVHGSPCEVYARIVGYYRAVRNWNKGKKEEYGMRALFNEPSAERLASEMPTATEHCDSRAFVALDIATLDKTRAFRRCAMQQVAKPQPVTNCHDLNETVTNSNRLTYRLFYRTTCPNCPPVKARMEGVAGGELVNVDTDEGLALAVKEGVLAAPTVIFYADGKETARAHNVGEIEAVLASIAPRYRQASAPDAIEHRTPMQGKEEAA